MPTPPCCTPWAGPPAGSPTPTCRSIPYNTYRYPGLPPGPIGAPGEAAIRAVLHPADVDYLYFVLRPDGSGRHQFARTLAEHNRNVRAYRQSLQEQGPPAGQDRNPDR